MGLEVSIKELVDYAEERRANRKLDVVCGNNSVWFPTISKKMAPLSITLRVHNGYNVSIRIEG